MPFAVYLRLLLCVTEVFGHTSKNKRSIEYQNMPSALRPGPPSYETCTSESSAVVLIEPPARIVVTIVVHDQS
jgi:hypothetical protein